MSISTRPPLSFLLSTLLTATMISLSVHAETVTLSTAMSKIEQAPKVEKAHSAAEEAGWKRVETYSGFLPVLNLSGSYLFDKKYLLTDINFGGNPTSVEQIIPTTSYSLTAQWLVFDGFANFDRWSAAKENEMASLNDYSWARFQQEREVVLLFYKALAAQNLKEVAEQNVKTLEDHLNDAKLLKKNGISTNYDLLQVEVRVSEAKSEVLNATDNMNIAILRLGEALGEDFSAAQLSGEMPALPLSLLDKLDTNANANDRKDLEALRHKVESISQQVDAASKHWLPKLSLYGAYQKYNNINDRFDDHAAYREAYNYGLQLSWNLFDGFADMAKKNQILEQRYQSEKNLKMAENKAANDLELWKRKLKYFISVYEARKSDSAKAKESVRLAKAGRKVGVRTNTELLDAELELFKANANVVNAQFGEIEALINLELSSGKKIYKF